MSRPIWLAHAETFIGLREIPGAQTEPRISAMLKKVRAWWSDDETPWCGAYLGAAFVDCGIPIPKAAYRAKDWLSWGRQLDMPTVGCVVVFDRKGGGHVALVTGQDQDGRLLCLGGNQGDAVNVRPFDRSRVAGYRWPPGEPYPAIAQLPIVASTAASSRNEA